MHKENYFCSPAHLFFSWGIKTRVPKGSRTLLTCFANMSLYRYRDVVETDWVEQSPLVFQTNVQQPPIRNFLARVERFELPHHRVGAGLPHHWVLAFSGEHWARFKSSYPNVQFSKLPPQPRWVYSPLVGADGVAPPEYLNNDFTDRPATIYGIYSH